MLSSSLAYQRIKALILEGGVKIDESLSERGLAERLNLGRMPVREALKELAAEGLVVSFQGRGTFVRQLTLKEVKDIYQARQAVEGMAARLACQNRLSPELERIGERLKRLERDPESDILEIQLAGTLLHRAVVEASGNHKLAEIFHSLEALVTISFRLVAEHRPSRIRLSASEHLALLEAIRSGEPGLSEKLMREHLAQAQATRLDILSGINPESKELRASG